MGALPLPAAAAAAAAAPHMDFLHSPRAPCVYAAAAHGAIGSATMGEMERSPELAATARD